MEKKCKTCKLIKRIVNSHFQLCIKCNESRLNEGKEPKAYKSLSSNKKPLIRKVSAPTDKSKKSLFVPQMNKTKTTKEKIQEDEVFYKKCFDKSNHKCEECSRPLPDFFRDENGKVAARWRYSHVIPKSIAPELRHNLNNINNLCLECHSMWENGNKSEMSIFLTNYGNFPDYLNKLITS
jgi:5-methylcytosine-specific restriction endonuclease McrA